MFALLISQISVTKASPYSFPTHPPYLYSLIVSILAILFLFQSFIFSIAQLYDLLLFSCRFFYPNIYLLALISMLQFLFLVHLASRIFSILDDLCRCLHLELFILFKNVDFCSVAPLNLLKKISLGILDN